VIGWYVIFRVNLLHPIKEFDREAKVSHCGLLLFAFGSGQTTDLSHKQTLFRATHSTRKSSSKKILKPDSGPLDSCEGHRVYCEGIGKGRIFSPLSMCVIVMEMS
jgi:hypothetical protein